MQIGLVKAYVKTKSYRCMILLLQLKAKGLNFANQISPS